MPPGTLGAEYNSFVVDNNLDANLLVNYKAFHSIPLEEIRAAFGIDRSIDMALHPADAFT